jgi:hypothetical protein
MEKDMELAPSESADAIEPCPKAASPLQTVENREEDPQDPVVPKWRLICIIIGYIFGPGYGWDN